MRLVRFAIGEQVRCGIVEGDRVRELLRPYYEGLTAMKTTHALAGLALLAPTRPSKMLCVASTTATTPPRWASPSPTSPSSS